MGDAADLGRAELTSAELIRVSVVTWQAGWRWPQLGRSRLCAVWPVLRLWQSSPALLSEQKQGPEREWKHTKPLEARARTQLTPLCHILSAIVSHQGGSGSRGGETDFISCWAGLRGGGYREE